MLIKSKLQNRIAPLRHLLLIVSLFFIYQTSFSQIYVTKTLPVAWQIEIEKLGDQEVEFIQVFAKKRFIVSNYVCLVSYGQAMRRPLFRFPKIRDTNKKRIVFNSEADIINYISKNGWDYVEFDGVFFVFRKNAS